MHTRNMHVHITLFYTLIESFLTPLDLHFAYPSLWIFHLLIRYQGRIPCITRSLEFSLLGLGISSCFLLFLSLDSLYCLDSALFYLIVHRIIYPCVRNLYVILQWFMLLLLIYITGSCHLRHSVYTWVFSSCTCVADSRHVPFLCTGRDISVVNICNVSSYQP